MTPWAASRQQSGRLFLVLIIVLLTGWALTLFKQSDDFVPDSVQNPDQSRFTHRRARLIARTNQSLLESFYRELQVTTTRLDPTGRERPRSSEVVVVIHPRAQAPAKLVEILEMFVAQGGRLILFTDSDLDLIRTFGLTSKRPNSLKGSASVVAATIDVAHVSELEAPVDRVFQSIDRPLVPLVTLNGQVVVGMTGYGKGAVTVVGMRFTELDWIETGDNAVFLANLVLEDRRASQVRVLDFDASILRDLYALDSEEAASRQDAIAKWKYDSLWSLIKANPVSAALFQLILAFLAFAVSRGRRLGAHLPDSLVMEGLPDPLRARMHLYQKYSTIPLAAARAILYNHRWLTSRLGLQSTTSRDVVRSRIAQESAAAAREYDGLLGKVSALCMRPEASGDPADLVIVWQSIDRIHEELDSGVSKSR